MSTLAERVLSAGSLPTYYNATGDYVRALQIWDWLQKHLKSRPSFVLAKPHFIERFCFDFDPIDVVEGMVDNNLLDYNTVFKACQHIPTDGMWFENHDHDHGHMGVMLMANEIGTAAALVLQGHYNPNPVPVCAFNGPPLPWKEGDAMTNLWTAYYSRKEEVSICEFAVHYIASCLFLLNVPRLCETRVSKGGHSAAKMQGHTYPPIEIKRVSMTIGIGNPRYEQTGPRRAGETEHQYRRRLHHVIGHFRTLTKKRTTPKVIWINEQWRGDASRGIIIRETHLKPPENKIT